MAKTKISEFSATPANNTDIDGINIAEGCAPSGINDAIRELMAQLKDWQSGTSNDPYVIGSSGSLTLNQGTANGVPYLNGSKVVTSGSALTFDGTNFATTGSVTSAGSSNSGNLAFTGTGNRITGDFSNATVANRVIFQSSTTNGASGVISIPNGTGVIASWSAQNSSDVANGANIAIRASNTDMSVRSGITGTGTYLPMTFYTGGSEGMRIDTSGQVGIGTSSPGYRLDVAAGDTTAGFGYAARLRSNATAAAATLQFTNSTVSAENGFIRVTDAGLMSFSNKAYIDSSGNLLVGTTSTVQNSALAIQRSNTTSAVTVANLYNSAATSTTRLASSVLRVSSNASGADCFINITDNVTNNYNFGGNNGGAYVVANTNGVRLANGGTSWASDSDERVKDIIEPITNAAEKVSMLRAVIGKYKTDEDGTRRAFLIAQDVQAVLPEAVFDEQGTLMLAYTDTIPLLVAAIKEQQAIITALTARVAALESN